MRTPPRNGTTRPGRVTTMTCQLTATVECVADMMYQETPMKFIPLPNRETNMAVKKKRKERWERRRNQLTRCGAEEGMGQQFYYRDWWRREGSLRGVWKIGMDWRWCGAMGVRDWGSGKGRRRRGCCRWDYRD